MILSVTAAAKPDAADYLTVKDVKLIKEWVGYGSFLGDTGLAKRRNYCKAMMAVWRKLPSDVCINEPVYRGISIPPKQMKELLVKGVLRWDNVGCASWSTSWELAFKYSIGIKGNVMVVLKTSKTAANKLCIFNVPGLAKLDWRSFRKTIGSLAKGFRSQYEVLLKDDGRIFRKDIDTFRFAGLRWDVIDPELRSYVEETYGTSKSKPVVVRKNNKLISRKDWTLEEIKR